MQLDMFISFLEKIGNDKSEQLKKEIEALVKKEEPKEEPKEEKKAETEIEHFITYWDLLKSKI